MFKDHKMSAIILAVKILVLVSVAGVILSLLSVVSFWKAKKKIDKTLEEDKLPKEPRKLTTLSDIQYDTEDLSKFNQETYDIINKWKNKK